MFLRSRFSWASSVWDAAAITSARGRFGDLLGPYADVAAAFLLAADEMVADDGVAGFVLPASVLA